VRRLGAYEHGDRLWLVVPSWDEGDDYEPAVGTAELVIAATEGEAREATAKDGYPTWIEVHELPSVEDIVEVERPRMLPSTERDREGRRAR
jgi:hypothetical protein